MSPHEKQPRSERDQTDESLRTERDKADAAIRDRLSAIEDAADEVINRARERADRVLAAARARTDRTAANAGGGERAPELVARERVLEDRVVEQERADADATLRTERAAHGALLTTERSETDKDLLIERARSDDSVATRDEFLSMVSHDLRNLLSSVAGFAGLITKEASSNDSLSRILANAQRIQRSSARMNRLIGDLMDVASIEAGALAVTPEPCDPSDVVTEAVENLRAQAAAGGLSLAAEIVPPMAAVPLDPARILQVLTNLLTNSIKFTPAGGSVAVRVERVGGELHFAVRDTGMGIPADKLEAVFERFVQINARDRRGMGLGLYISKCIVQGHGGRIWAESTLGRGSTMHFTLPAGARR